MTPKRRAWKAFSKFIRLRDALKTTGRTDYLRCCTCRKEIKTVGEAQAGHFLPGRKNSILFDEDCVHGQCMRCNIYLRGNWPNYLEFMIKEHGQEVVDELLKLRKTTRQYKKSDYVEIEAKYKAAYKELSEAGKCAQSLDPQD